VLGSVVCFFGKKIFNVFLFVVGFAALSAATFFIETMVLLNNPSIQLNKGETIAIPLVAGFIGGCLALLLVKVGLFVVGAIVGALLSFIIFALVGNHFGSHANIIRIVFLCFCSLACGCLVVQLEQKIIIFMSAVGGSYAIFAGADHWIQSGYVAAIRGVFSADALPHNDKLYVMIAGNILVAVFGIVFQSVMERKEKRESKEAGWESESLLSRGVNY